jgi:hypothetical protein
MLHINLAALEGQSFVGTGVDTTTEYVCIGYGQSPSDGANYIVGQTWDQASNRTIIQTFLFKNLRFIGKLPVSKAP